MRTITLQIDDSISEKFLWLLARFSRDEIKILEQSDYTIFLYSRHNECRLGKHSSVDVCHGFRNLVLGWAKSMTGKRLHPIISLSQKVYQKGITLTKKEMKEVKRH